LIIREKKNEKNDFEGKNETKTGKKQTKMRVKK
jgi:hypothetical protein